MSDPSAPEQAPFAGTSRFRPIALLGRGSMGVVYRVLDLETGAEVALKTLAVRDPHALFGLKQEFRVLSDISHENLVDLYELIVGARDCFFTMEAIEGRPFTEHVRDGCAASAAPSIGAICERFLDGARQLTRGLEAVHHAGKLHRDLKPSNILVTREGRVVLLDFGLAMALGFDAGFDGSDDVVGTFAYMAPEQAWGAGPAPAADWYSVGVVFYEALAGRLPFEGSPASLFEAKRRGAFRSLADMVPGIPSALDAVVSAMLHPEPERRPDAATIRSALEGWSTHPQRAPADPRRAFVGRTGELARLRAAYADVRAGRLAVAHVRGPSGIGKSEILRRFSASVARDDGALVLAGRCNLQEAIPFKAVDRLVDALSRHLVSLPPAEWSELAPTHLSALLRLFPVLGRVGAWSDLEQTEEAVEPQEIRRRGFVALRELLVRLAARGAVVLCIDDVQWSDPDSVALLREVLADPEPPAVLLILSYRSDDEPALPALARLAADGGALPACAPHVIEVGPLADAEAIELARRMAADPIEADDRLSALLAEAAGNPFFVGELARSLQSPGARRFQHLNEIVADRIGRLGEAAREILEVVCVAGRPFERSVILDAVGLGERGRPVVASLEKRSLVRITHADEGYAVEVYHDRIRDALLESIETDALRSRHGQLADVLARQDEPDPASLLRHLREAERPREAAIWATRAADRASAALAFTDAAELYDEALRLGEWDRSARGDLLARRADALVNAGHCGAAAPIYREAAAQAPRSEGFDLRRRAAAQFLISGRIDDGVRELRSLLDDIGLRYPRTPRSALAAAVGRALQLAAGRLRFDARLVEQLSPDVLTRVDTCHFAAKGLLAVDPARGVYFAVISLLHALRAGETKRIGRDLGTLGAALAAASWPLSRVGATLIERADRIARSTDDPYLLGNVMLATASMKLVRGSWLEMLALCDSAEQLLRDRCQGVTPELNLARMVAIRALEELGDLPEVRARTEQLERAGMALGDLYAQTTARLNAAFWRLAAGDPPSARAESRRALAPWTQGTNSMQHFYALRVEVCCDVYEGSPQIALDRLSDAWPAIRRSQLLLDPVTRADAYGLRARTALAVAQRNGNDRLLAGAAADARALGRLRRPDGVGDAALIRAGIAALRGESEAARKSLEAAERTYARAGMKLDAMVARRRRAEGATTTARAELDRTLVDLGIADPAAWLSVQAPGFSG